MSKEFGLDWQKYGYKRMNDFIMIMQIQNKMSIHNSKQSKHGNSKR